MSQELRRLEVDFDRASAFAEYEYVVVNFPTANSPVTIRHQLSGPSESLIYAIMGVVLLNNTPTETPAVYEIAGLPRGTNYVKLHATQAGVYTLLLGIQR